MAGDLESGGLQSFISGIESSARRLKSNFEAIFEKYDKPFEDNDLINISTLSICKDKGYLRKVQGCQKFGASKLASTKRKEEIFRSQVGRPAYTIDPNVSMAIARRCVSYLNDTEAGEAEPSDAETLSSESTDDERDDDDDDGDDDEEDNDAGDSKDNSDEGDSVEDEKEKSDVSDTDSVDGDAIVISSSDDCSDKPEEQWFGGRCKGTERRSSVCEENADDYRKGKDNKAKYDLPEIGPKVDKFTKPSIHKLLIPSPENKQSLSDSHTLLNDTASPGNISITSSFRSLSFVSIQSPDRSTLEQGRKKNNSSGGLVPGAEKFLNNTYTTKTPGHGSNKHRESETVPRCRIQTESSKDQQLLDLQIKDKARLNPGQILSPAQRSDFQTFNRGTEKLPRRLELKTHPGQTSSVPHTSQSWYKREEKSLSRQYVAQQKYGAKTTGLVLGPPSAQPTGSEKLHTFQKNSPTDNETFSVAHKYNEFHIVPRSPVKTFAPPQATAVADSVFKSPQGIKVKRVCPTAVKDGKSSGPTSPQQTSPSTKRGSSPFALAEASSQKSPRVSEDKHQYRSKKDLHVFRALTESTLNESDHCKSRRSNETLISAPIHSIQGNSHSSFISDGSNQTDVNGLKKPHHLISSSTNKNTDENFRPSGEFERKMGPRLRAPSVDVSFSSTDDDMQEEVRKSYSFILESPVEENHHQILSSPGKRNEGSCKARKQLYTQLAPAAVKNNMAAQSIGDISLTTSLKNLDIQPHFSNIQKSPLQQKGDTLNYNPVSDDHSSKSFRTGSMHRDLVSPGNIELISNTSSVPKNCTCIITPCFGSGQVGTRSVTHNGFDPRKWTSEISKTASPSSNRQILSPTFVGIKRKASDSYTTSGYFTDVSVSTKAAHGVCCLPLAEQISGANTTFTVEIHSKDPSHQQSSNYMQGNNLDQVKYLQTSGRTDECQASAVQVTNIQKLGTGSPLRINYEEAKRRFAVAKKRLKSPSAASKAQDLSLHPDQDRGCIHSEFCNLHQSILQQQQQSPKNMQHQHWQQPVQPKDPRVCEWVQAISQNAGYDESAYHYASCPPKIPSQFLRNNLLGPHLQAHGSHQPECGPQQIVGGPHQPVCHPHWPACHPNQSLLENNSHHVAPNTPPSLKRDIGVQASLSSPAVQPNFGSPHEFLHENYHTCSAGFLQPAVLSEEVNPRNEVCTRCSNRQTTPIGRTRREDHQDENEGTMNSASASALYNQSPKMKTNQQLLRNNTNCRPTENHLSKRALSVWREIQSEISVLDSEMDDSEIHFDSKPSSNPKIKNGKRNTFGVKEILSNQSAAAETQTDISYDHRLCRIAPEQGRAFRGTLSKELQGIEVPTRSFVEMHSPKPKAAMLTRNPITVTESFSQQVKNVMFPPSYIYKFSPFNPSRTDSDATTFQYEQERAASLPSLKECLKTFRPRRHHRPSLNNASHHLRKEISMASKDVDLLQKPAWSEPDLPCQGKPCKQRKLSGRSPGSPAVVITPSNVSCNLRVISSQKTDHSYINDLPESSWVSSNEKNNHMEDHTSDQSETSKEQSIFHSSHEHLIRASTPENKHNQAVDLSIDDSLSTIHPPTISDVEDGVSLYDSSDNLENTLVHQDGSTVTDSDSSDEVSLL